MTEETQRRLSGASKVFFGILGIKGACAIAAGSGLVGEFCKNHHMMTPAKMYAKQVAKRNFDKICIGWRELFTNESVESDIRRDKEKYEGLDTLGKGIATAEKINTGLHIIDSLL